MYTMSKSTRQQTARFAVLLAFFCVIGNVVPPVFGEGDDLADASGIAVAYSRAREWISAYSVPRGDDESTRVPIERASASYILLRYHGQVVGEGMDDQWDDGSIRRTAMRALSDFHSNPRIAHVHIDLRPALGAELTLELEVAGPLFPLVGDTFDAVGARIEPGLDGIAMRAGERWVWRFPSQMRSSPGGLSADPEFLLRELLSDLRLRPRELAALRAEEGLSIYRFRTVHLAQEEPTKSPFVSFRGSRVVGLADVQIASLSSFAEALADHIMRREWGRPEGLEDQEVADALDEITHTLREEWETPERRAAFDQIAVQEDARLRRNPPVGIMGNYDPLTDRYSPLIASPFDQALASLALSHFAKVEGVDGVIAGRAASFAEQLLLELAEVLEEGFGETDPLKDPVACAMIVLAAEELRPSNPARSLAGLRSAAILECWRAFDVAAGAFGRVSGPDGSERELVPSEKAIVAAAITRIAFRDPPADNAFDVARAALDAAWGSVDDVNHISLLPWIGWAERDYMLIGDAPAAATRLAVLRARIEGSQVTHSHAGVYERFPIDLSGGCAIASGSRTAATIQGVRPFSWIARLLADPREVPDDALESALFKAVQFARFMMQHAVSEHDVWQFPAPRRALGGVREALWDPVQMIPAQALCLICASDIMKGIDRYDKMR